MSYRIVVDSCGELTKEMKESGNFVTASLGIDIQGYHIADDETFDQADFLKKVAESPSARNHPVHRRILIWNIITVMQSMFMQSHSRQS